jgi:hypothetical protein
MFKEIILCTLYNLSDDQVEYQLRDRLSLVRIGEDPGLGPPGLRTPEQ